MQTIVEADLIEQQKEIEQECLTAGIERYRRQREKQGEVATKPGQTLMKRALEPMTEAIKKYVEDVLENGRPVRGAATVAKFLSQVDPEVGAYITAKYTLNAITKEQTLQSLALSIAQVIEDAINHEALEKANPGLYRVLMRKIEKSTHDGYRHVALRRQQKFAKVETIKWAMDDRLKLGQLLIHLFIESTGLVEQTPGTQRTAPTIVPSAGTLEWLEKSHARCELLSPVFLPMVVKPRPWTGPFNGGYLTKHLKFPLVKTANRNYLEELRSWEMPKVYAAVNAMQETAWAINTDVLAVMREVWEGGGTLGGLPSREPLPLPAKNFPEDATSDDPRVRAWRQSAASVYEENTRLVSKRLSTMFKIETAERFSKFEALYFPHALDWRGRAYPVSSHVNPQADDSGKALLRFANGCALGDNGAYWLAVHGANCFGVDKVSYDDRVQWVNDHADQIIESAANPLDGSRWWADAENAYQFLAFCFEWAEVVAHYKAGKAISEYVSYLPVSLDGSCNGLQNFSAMLRDHVGGKATNLVPSDKPSDIYSEVARVAASIAEKDAASDDEKRAEMGRKWKDGFTRKLVKRNTMTVPYAVSEFGMRDQVMQELRKMDPRGYSMEDAVYIAKVNHEAIGKVVIAARAAMDWLKEVARVVAKDGLPVKWVAPSGMLVVQNYRTYIGKRFESYITGQRVRMMLRIESDEMNKRKMASGISPNFVHSADAAHMVQTINRCLDAGLRSFAMVHDSFGTHAGNIDTLAHELRAAFVDQYSADVLGEFRRQIEEQLPPELAKELPPVPPFGDLRVEDVLNSDYFFA